MELWVNDEVIDQWLAEPSGRPGSQTVYSDFAIEIIISLGKVFHQKLRQTEGLLEYIFQLMNIELAVPDYTTMSRRAGKLNILLAKKAAGKNEKKIIVIDSTGLKVYGEGEWKVRQHGVSRRRTWRKAHLAVTAGFCCTCTPAAVRSCKSCVFTGPLCPGYTVTGCGRDGGGAAFAFFSSFPSRR